MSHQERDSVHFPENKSEGEMPQREPIMKTVTLDELQQQNFRQRQAVALIRHYGEMTALSDPVQGVASDPDDDHVLAAAVSGQAAYIVTGDKPLQSVGSYQGVKIVSPREFLELLEN